MKDLVLPEIEAYAKRIRGRSRMSAEHCARTHIGAWNFPTWSWDRLKARS